MTHLAVDQKTAVLFLSGMNTSSAASSPWVDVRDSETDTSSAVQIDAIDPANSFAASVYGATVSAATPRESRKIGLKSIRPFGKPGSLLYDIKGIFGKSVSNMRL